MRRNDRNSSHIYSRSITILINTKEKFVLQNKNVARDQTESERRSLLNGG